MSLVLGALLSGCGNTTVTSEIDGTFRTACHAERRGAARATQSAYQEMVFGNGSFAASVKYFSDTACATLSATETVTSTFATGDAVTAPAGAKKIDITLKSVSITLATAETAAEANASSSCGFTDWAVGQAKDVMGKPSSCSEAGAEVTADEKLFTIYELTGTTLKLGNPGSAGSATDGTSDTKRPTALSSTVATKQ